MSPALEVTPTNPHVEKSQLRTALQASEKRVEFALISATLGAAADPQDLEGSKLREVVEHVVLEVWRAKVVAGDHIEAVELVRNSTHVRVLGRAQAGEKSLCYRHLDTVIRVCLIDSQLFQAVW